MASAVVHLGLPHYPRSQAVEQPRRIGVPEPFNWPVRSIIGFRWEGPYRLRPLPNHVQYGTTTVTANRVTRIANIIWGDGDADVVRHTGTSFHESSAGVWASRIGAFALAATDSSYWGGSVVQSASAANPGKGVYLFSCRSESGGLDHIFFWTGSGNISNTWTAGAPEPGRFVVNYADRAFIFNQSVAGQTRARRGQWSIPGEALSWTGTGSGSREFAELDNEITSAFTLRGSLYVCSERAILMGSDTFSAQSPVHYSYVASNGIGVWAPNSLIPFEDQVAFLSLRGFIAFDGRQFRDIGGPDINQQIMQSIFNRTTANTICGAHLPAPWNLLIWALPLFGVSLPNQVYAYDYVHDTWLPFGGGFYLSNSNVTAMDTLTRGASVPWSALVGSWPAQTARWSELGGAATFPGLLTGHNTGQIRVWDTTAGTNLNVATQIDTPILTFEGLQVGRAQARADDVKTLDSVEVNYRTTGDSQASSLLVFASTDEGVTFQHFGTMALNTSGAPGISRRVRVDGRISGTSFIIRLASSGFVGTTFFQFRPNWMLEDWWIRVRTAGVERSVA